MSRIRKILSSAVVVTTIAAGIVATFTLVRMADGDVEAAPIVKVQP